MPEEQRQDPKVGTDIGATDEQGRLEYDLPVSGDSAVPRRWYLKLNKDGFEPRVIDISTGKPAAERGTPLPVTIALKPVVKQP